MDTEKKYTEEEMKAIANEEIRKAGLKANKELNLDEMEKVSGGIYVPDTHEEIDRLWDIVQDTMNRYGSDVAYLTAKELNLVAGKGTLFTDYSTGVFRQRMHDEIDGKLNMKGLDAWSAH